MRITNSSLTTNYLRNLSRNLSQMQKYQNQLSSGKEISKPSENPLLVSKIMDLRNSIGLNEQYNTNISDTLGWVQTQDGSLDGVTGTLQKIRELMIYGANGSLAVTDRGAIRDEIVQNIQGLKDTLNTNFDGRYIFGGTETTNAPFEVDADNNLIYNGNSDTISRQIAKGVSTDLISNGDAIVGSFDIATGENDLGKLLKNVITALEAGDTDSLSGDLLKDVDIAIDKILSTRSKIGAIDNRLEASKSRNESEKLNLTSLLSQKEDIDIAEKYMEYSVMSTVYQASLAAGAKVLQPSLLDYLR
ncbi:MAG: flagellar hook-associated protein FlgL [Gudongella sp.]|nr:flagellar hook-associated protein FlgL [Gudongella sp.]